MFLKMPVMRQMFFHEADVVLSREMRWLKARSPPNTQIPTGERNLQLGGYKCGSAAGIPGSEAPLLQVSRETGGLRVWGPPNSQTLAGEKSSQPEINECVLLLTSHLFPCLAANSKQKRGRRPELWVYLAL